VRFGAPATSSLRLIKTGTPVGSAIAISPLAPTSVAMSAGDQLVLNRASGPLLCVLERTSAATSLAAPPLQAPPKAAAAVKEAVQHSSPHVPGAHANSTSLSLSGKGEALLPERRAKHPRGNMPRRPKPRAPQH
jgi:hypothetical protein